MKRFAMLILAAAGFLTSCGEPPQNFTATFNGVTAGTPASFTSNQGGADGLDLTICGEGSFTGKVSVSLENAPSGVSITTPANLEFIASNCAATALAPAIVVAAKNFILGVSSTATIGTNIPFKVVLSSKNVTKKIDATITIQVPPL